MTTNSPNAAREHTMGRLAVGHEGDSLMSGVYYVAMTHGNLSGHATREANAARLAACWNACEGIETTDLTSRVVLMDSYDTLRAEVERLRGELESMRGTLRTAFNRLDPMMTPLHLKEHIRAALAPAKVTK